VLLCAPNQLMHAPAEAPVALGGWLGAAARVGAAGASSQLRTALHWLMWVLSACQGWCLQAATWYMWQGSWQMTSATRLGSIGLGTAVVHSLVCEILHGHALVVQVRYAGVVLGQLHRADREMEHKPVTDKGSLVTVLVGGQ
jgi:hypothetical protein